MAAATDEFRVFFEMLPHVLRDEDLRRRIALLYRWYWSMKLEWLGAADPAAALDDPDLLGLAQLLSAVIDGLAVQAAVDPSIDLDNPCRAFARMLEAVGPADLGAADEADAAMHPGRRRPGRRREAGMTSAAGRPCRAAPPLLGPCPRAGGAASRDRTVAASGGDFRPRAIPCRPR